MTGFNRVKIRFRKIPLPFKWKMAERRKRQETKNIQKALSLVQAKTTVHSGNGSRDGE